MNLQLDQLKAPYLDSPTFRKIFARGIVAPPRNARELARLGESGRARRAQGIRELLAPLRAFLGSTELFEVSAPHRSPNTKLAKNASVTLAFSGAPAAESGFEVCPARGECARFCVLGSTCGLARVEEKTARRIFAPNPAHDAATREAIQDRGAIMRARILRARALALYPFACGIMLTQAARRARRLATRDGARCVARLNVGTDIGFEAIPEVAALFRAERIRAYAYTKRPAAVRAAMRARGCADGTRIVYSWSERASEVLAREYLDNGGTVAVVFSGLGVGRARASLPTRWTIGGAEYRCIDGDAQDDRTLDPRGVIVALRGKGDLATNSRARIAQRDPLGFAIFAGSRD